MPSHDLLVRPPPFPPLTPTVTNPREQLYFQTDLTLLQSWYLNGKHYTRTLEDWLARQDMNAEEGMGQLVKAQGGGGEGEGRKVFYRCVSGSDVSFLFIVRN
jgi:hypothetical protein